MTRIWLAILVFLVRNVLAGRDTCGALILKFVEGIALIMRI